MVTLTDSQVKFIKSAVDEALSLLEWPEEELDAEAIDAAIQQLDDAIAVLEGKAVVV